MFAENEPMTLTDVKFTTEVVDDETRRIVECTFKISPFTPVHAEALNVRSLLFEARTSSLKPAIDAVVLQIEVPLQRLTFAMAPDQVEKRIIFDDVQVLEKFRVKVKRDRDPAQCDAVLQVNFRYPSAEDLLYIANGVNDTHYLTFAPLQGSLGLQPDAEGTAPKHRKPVEAGDKLREGVFAEH